MGSTSSILIDIVHNFQQIVMRGKQNRFDNKPIWILVTNSCRYELRERSVTQLVWSLLYARCSVASLARKIRRGKSCKSNKRYQTVLLSLVFICSVVLFKIKTRITLHCCFGDETVFHSTFSDERFNLFWTIVSLLFSNKLNRWG